MTNEVKNQSRRFEVVSKYEGKGINLPIRKTKYSAGYDVESAVEITIPSMWEKIGLFNKEYSGINGYKDINRYVNKVISDGGSIADIMKESGIRPTLIPTGIKVCMHEDENVELLSRSSTPMKMGLIVSNSLGLIDKDYYNNPSNEGEMFVQVLNFLPFDVTVRKGQPIAQAVFRKYLITDDDSASGDRIGGHGSTDEKESDKTS